MIFRIMMKIAFFCILMLYAVTGSNGQELQPSEGTFSGGTVPEPYRLALREGLLGEHPYRKCQMLVIPSFRAEWAVYMIREKVEEPQIVFKIFEKPLWSVMMNQIKAEAGSNSYSVGAAAQSAALAKLSKTVPSHVKPIPVPTADLLEQVWSTMLDCVRYPQEDPTGLDGVTYYFCHWAVRKGYRSGQAWSPFSGSRAAALVELAENLRAYAVAESEQNEKLNSMIIAKATTLLSHVPSNEK